MLYITEKHSVFNSNKEKPCEPVFHYRICSIRIRLFKYALTLIMGLSGVLFANKLHAQDVVQADSVNIDIQISAKIEKRNKTVGFSFDKSQSGQDETRMNMIGFEVRLASFQFNRLALGVELGHSKLYFIEDGDILTNSQISPFLEYYIPVGSRTGLILGPQLRLSNFRMSRERSISNNRLYYNLGLVYVFSKNVGFTIQSQFTNPFKVMDEYAIRTGFVLFIP